MRKESKGRTEVSIATVQGYHGGNYRSESYAFEGFASNKYFTSDRFIQLDGNFRRPDGKPLCGIGLEIETECWQVKDVSILADVFSKIIFPVFPADLFKMQHDGSLGHRFSSYANDAREEHENQCVGIECITQVMTKSFVRNHYKDFKAMFNKYFSAFDISASKSGNCGMHVNISNAMFGNTTEKQIEAIRKLHYFVNKNYSFACKLFKRNEAATGYCGPMEYRNAKTMTIGGGDHYHCINYSHFRTGRIELRLVGGQADYYALRNTLETVFFLVERMRTINWGEIDDMTKVFKGCNQYVFKRLSDCSLPVATMDAIRDNLKPEDLEVA